MALEIELIFALIVSGFSAMTAIFGITLLYQIFSNKKKYSQNKITSVFGLLALSFILWAIADLLWSILPFLGIEPAWGVPEYFYIAGYILGIISFLSFIKLSIKDSTFGELVPFLLLSIPFTGLTILSLKYFIIPFENFSLFEFITAYLYPFCSGLILVLSSSIYSFMKKAGNFGRPLFLIAIGFLFCYLGDLAYTYYSLRETYGFQGIFSDSVYIVQYILTSIAFYMVYLQFKKEEIKK
jgi:hypothetical protein